jgi:hypothetical protein
VLQLDTRDNVWIALTDLKAGERVEFGDQTYTLLKNVEGFGVCRTRVNFNQLSASHFNLLEMKVFVWVNTPELRIALQL